MGPVAHFARAPETPIYWPSITGSQWRTRMDVCRALAGRSSKFVKPGMTLLIVSAAACGMALAQEKPTGGPTPSAPGAGAYFSDPKDGATIPPKPPHRLGRPEMGAPPAAP